MRGYYPGYHTGFFGLGYGWYGWIEMILVGVVIFAVIYLLIKGLTRKDNYRDAYYVSGGTQKNKALEILKEQFARGEISEEEFLRKRKLIEE
ncbi:putative membrane protein [Marinitoga piezophila KA3]|uniref:Putative membrane protein n=1 Tax=Marinitoga piezophila (strain DSM 14283 / JCM 11233 / KA3) TaxID=443254 RepID=H2J7F4_MARPK|nr:MULTISPECIES: SHOCT domain-containing protein [Marinitoga]AEX86447.1 putative membrane protein [Marinitoga piezophila KA3]APT76835.1 hypothetical protein LN42_10940 [Marinitoga sp. 1137]